LPAESLSPPAGVAALEGVFCLSGATNSGTESRAILLPSPPLLARALCLRAYSKEATSLGYSLPWFEDELRIVDLIPEGLVTDFVL
jgi:hypothetical protein